MDSQKLIYHIPNDEIRDIASFFEAVKRRVTEEEGRLSHGIYLRGPNKGICIEVIHPDLDENKPPNTLTVHVSYEGFQPKS